MKRLITLIAVSVSLIACQPEGRVYVEHQELSAELEWLKSDVKTLKVPVEDNAVNYNLSLSFRFATGYQYETANVKVTETSPSGVETVNEYELTVRTPEGDYLGEAGLDIWDSEHLVEANKQYAESGTYTYVIEQNTPVDPLNFAMEIGVILDKAK